MNIANSLKQHASTMPGATALIEPVGRLTKRVTFAELEQHTNQLASFLLRHGVKQGDAVLILHPMSIELYEFLIALFKIGAIALFLDPTFGSEYIRRAFQLCKPTASFIGGKAAVLNLVEPELRSISKRFSPALMTLSRLTFNNMTESRTEFDTVELEPDAPALVTFTSGSTGKPKAIVRSHGFLQHQLAVLKHTLNLHPGQVDLTSLPVFMLANIAAGVTSVIPDSRGLAPSAMKGHRLLRQITRHNITRITAPPAVLKRICQAANKTGQKLPSLRRIFTGGGPVFPDLLLDTQSIAPHADINILYGSTESEPIATVSFSQIRAADMIRMCEGGGLLAGIPHPDLRIRLLGSGAVSAAAVNARLPRSQTERSGNFEIGEILVTGKHVIKGYLNGEGDSETKIEIDGEIWHRTGDAGYFDEEGRPWLVGRASATIHDARGTLFPFQVESAARHLPGVAQAACIQHGGKRILLVQPDRPLAPLFSRRVHKFRAMGDRLKWAKIDAVIPVRKIPLDPRHNSKLNYPAISAMLSRIGRGISPGAA